MGKITFGENNLNDFPGYHDNKTVMVQQKYLHKNNFSRKTEALTQE